MKSLFIKLMTGLALPLLLFSAAAFLPGRSVLADPQPLQQIEDKSNQSVQNQNVGGANCSNSSDAGITKCLQTNPIVKDLNVIVNFLSAGVGVVVIGTIILGGVQYIMAGDSPEGVKKARQRITNGILALIVYLLIFGVLQWIVPGGVFNS